MPRISCRVWLGMACALAVVASPAWAARPAESLFPKTTVGFVSVAQVDRLDQQWKKTQLGKLMEDAVMKPFREDLRAQLKARWSKIRQRFGLSLEDLRDIAGGEVAAGLIEPKPGEAAAAVMVDVNGRVEKARAVLAKATATMVAQGAVQKQIVEGGTTILVFDFPPAAAPEATAPPAATAATAPPAAAAGPAAPPPAAAPPDRVIYFLSNDILCAGDNLDVVRGMLDRLTAKKSDSLADITGFQMTMKRCAADAGPLVPQVRWFVYPLGYAEAARAATPKEQRRKGKTIIEIMRNQGFGAVRGVGGFVNISEEGYEIIHRTAVYAPKPWENSMKMFVLPNRADFTPQPWVSREIATYTTLYVNILNAFDNFGPLFDELFGEGEKGVWIQTLDSFKNDPHGPQIDLKEELVKKLGERVTMVTDYELPITPTSERLLFAIETNDPGGLAKAIEKCVKSDPTMKRKEINGQIIWEVVEEEERQPEAPSISLGDVPAVGGKKDKDEEEAKEHFLPHGAVTVANGHLLVASHLEFLLKVLKPVPERNQLRNNPQFRQVSQIMQAKLGLKEQCAREFSWTDEEIRPTYELIRQGKMPQSETLLGRALNTLAGAGKKGVTRQQRIDGRKLPDYQVVRRALGPAGLAVTSEPDGWFIKGFLLPH